MQEQGDGSGSGSGSGSDSCINPDQRQYRNIHEWLNQGSPSSLISQMVQSGIGTENHRRAFFELMNQVDAELTARGIGFQRSNPETANGQVGNGPSVVQQGSVSGARPRNIDLNVTYEGNSNNSMLGFAAYSTIRAEREAADQNLPGANSSNPILISSGDAPRQLLLGESSRSVQQARVSEQDDVPANENASSALSGQSNVNHFGQLEAVTGVGMPAASAMHENQNLAGGITILESAGIDGAPTVNNYQLFSLAAAGFGGGSVMNQTSSVARNGSGNQASIRARQAENFQRNIRLRRNPTIQAPPSLFTQNIMNSQVQSPNQTAMFFPFDHFLNSRAQPVHIAPAPQFVQVPEPFQTQQVQVPGQGVTMSGAREASSSSAHTQPQQRNLVNNPRNVMFPAGFEPGNLSHVAANMNLANGNTNFPGNVAPSAASQDASNSNSRISVVPIWYTDQAIRHANRTLEIIRRAENPGLQGDNRPARAVSVAAAEDTENSIRGGSMRPRMRPRMSRLMPRAERQDADYPDNPRRAQQLVSEVHNAFELVTRGGGLRFEDIMMLNRSVLLGLPEEEEEEDELEDMRLDIDGMTYEELIALGNKIGNVSTGLREEAIFAHLKVQKYVSFKVRSPDKAPRCCICQEDYADEEHVGKLDCEHDFHANCIKQWLMQKNQCPICKKTGLACKQRKH